MAHIPEVEYVTVTDNRTVILGYPEKNFWPTGHPCGNARDLGEHVEMLHWHLPGCSDLLDAQGVPEPELLSLV